MAAGGSMPLAGDLEALVTVIVTTSPMRSDPECEVLKIVFRSLQLVELHNCRRILLCDHFQKCAGRQSGADSGGGQDYPKGGASNLKGGVVAATQWLRYQQRLQRLRLASWTKGVEIIELDEWHGFSLATQKGLSLVSTPLVCIIQHDLAFVRDAALKPITEILMFRRANFITFSRPSQRHYREELRLRTGLQVGGPVRFGSTELTRLPQFLDGTHIARVDWSVIRALLI